jgi:hypothetical protein
MMFFAIMAVSCTPSNEKGVEGAWQYVSGSYVSGDSTTTLTSDDLKSIKIYGDNHYSVVTQDLSNDEVFPHSGLYKVDGDSYTELFKIHHNPNMIEKSETFKYRLDNNQLIISSDYMQETWVRLE